MLSGQTVTWPWVAFIAATLLILTVLGAPAQAPSDNLMESLRPISGVQDLEARFRSYVTETPDGLLVRDDELAATWHIVPFGHWQITCGDVPSRIAVTFSQTVTVVLARGEFSAAECRLYGGAIAHWLR